MTDSANRTDINGMESDYQPQAPAVIDQEQPSQVKNPADEESGLPVSNEPQSERKLKDSPSKVENLPDAPSAVSSKSFSLPSNTGCITASWIFSVLILAGAVAVGYFWFKAHAENNLLRDRLDSALKDLETKESEKNCADSKVLEQRQVVMTAQVANILASPPKFIVKNFNTETYPIFSQQFRNEYLQQAALKLYLVWNTVDAFVYDDASSECVDCLYSPPQQLENGDIYIGQWKNEQKFGRGTEILANGNVREGYYQDGMFVGKRREIDQSGKTSEWTAEGKLIETEYLCLKSSNSCWVKVPEESAPQESDETEAKQDN